MAFNITSANESTIGAILTIFGLLVWANCYLMWRVYYKKKILTDSW